MTSSRTWCKDYSEIFYFSTPIIFITYHPSLIRYPFSRNTRHSSHGFQFDPSIQIYSVRILTDINQFVHPSVHVFAAK
jgi:hypothetical protein